MKLKQRIALCWRILRAEPGNLFTHADRELPKSDDEMQALMNQQLREMLLVFSTHGHSGFSASWARTALNALLAYKPLGPLTGKDDEWVDHGEGMFQNKRCGAVFKQPDRFDGQAYYLDGKVFREPSGSCYTSKDSMVPIVFPYTPTTEYVDVAGETE